MSRKCRGMSKGCYCPACICQMSNNIYDVLERGSDNVRFVALAMKVCAGMATSDLEKIERGAARRLKPEGEAPGLRECGWCGLAVILSDAPSLDGWRFENPGIPIVANDCLDFCSHACQQAHKDALVGALESARMILASARSNAKAAGP